MASSRTPNPMATIAPVLRPPALFVDAVVELDGEVENGMEKVSDGAAVFRDMDVPVAVARVVAAIVYPAFE